MRIFKPNLIAGDEADTFVFSRIITISAEHFRAKANEVLGYRDLQKERYQSKETIADYIRDYNVLIKRLVISFDDLVSTYRTITLGGSSKISEKLSTDWQTFVGLGQSLNSELTNKLTSCQTELDDKLNKGFDRATITGNVTFVCDAVGSILPTLETILNSQASNRPKPKHAGISWQWAITSLIALLGIFATLLVGSPGLIKFANERIAVNKSKSYYERVANSFSDWKWTNGAESGLSALTNLQSGFEENRTFTQDDFVRDIQSLSDTILSNVSKAHP